jgi:periplasmic divalent cation tolerance protein
MKVLLCNAPEDSAYGIAKTLVSEGSAACVTISAAAKSIYIWDGELCDETEVTLTLKVAAAAAAALRDRLVDLHPYEVPEVLCLAVDPAASHRPYIDWVSAATTG